MNSQEHNFPNDPQVTYWTAPPQPAPEEAPKQRTYTLTDTAYAWFSIIAAFLFCQAVPVTRHPLGGFLVIAGLFITAFIIFRIKEIKLLPVCILTAISAFVISLALILTESPFLVKLAYTYCVGFYCFFLYAALGNRIENGFSDYIYIDFIKILFILPFHAFSAIFPALSNESTKKGSRFMLKLLIGIAIAVLPTIIILGLLSYDDGFMKILDDIFSIDGSQIGHIILSLIFALPLAMYGFGLYTSSKEKFLKEQMTAESCENGLQRAKILPQITAVVAVLPILFLYVVFFISQWQYYVSGFTGVLPENLSYAEYARQGFFELCAVSVINLLLITAIAFFIKRSKENKSIILKIITVVFCLCTLILICTAVAKLIMYIDYYGLTQKRIYAMWLMIVIGIVFLIIALGQFFSKIKIVALSLTVTIVMFAGLCLCNVNALTAKYNTDRFLNGTLETLDVEAMEDLGDSAIPSLVRVAKATKDPELKIDIDVILCHKAVELRDEKFSIFRFSIPSMLAKFAMEDYTPQIPPVGVYGMSSIVIEGQTTTYDNEIVYSNYLIVRSDGTATLYYNDKRYPVEFDLDQATYNGITYEVDYYPSEGNRMAWLSLRCSNASNYVRIVLKAVR